MILVIDKYGAFVGLRGERLYVSYKDGTEKEYPLKKLKCVFCENAAISISSELLLECSARGVHFFIFNYKRQIATCLYSANFHSIYKLREKQFHFIKTSKATELARAFAISKSRNQRSLLLYFASARKIGDSGNFVSLINEIDNLIEEFDKITYPTRDLIFGYEGTISRKYWEAAKSLCLLPDSFSTREKRGSREIANICLNYGYAILSGYIWRALQLAGLEVYAGFLHSERAGKPSLVLDFMEPFRPWVVDRVVFKLSKKISPDTEFDQNLKKEIIADITSFMRKKFAYKNKKLTLETIIQRQAYKLAGAFYGNELLKPFLFKR